jgi:hypothetical protein
MESDHRRQVLWSGRRDPRSSRLWDYDARLLAEGERESLSSLARTGRVGLTGAQLLKTDAF